VRSYLPANPVLPIERKRIELPDGDFLDVEVSGGERDKTRPVVIILHGLEGSSSRPYMRAMANHLNQSGFQTVAMNFRGCSGEPNRSRITYHAGKYDDLEQVIHWVIQTLHPPTLHLTGFSLGASITLNFLIHSKLKRTIASAVAISAPLQLGAISDDLQHGIRTLYQYYFLRSLRNKNLQKICQFPDYPRFSGATLREFDDQVTASVHGFQSAEHYYETCSTGPKLKEISTPIRLIHALNDPICLLPTGTLETINHGWVEWSVQRGGGHVAFMTLPGGWLGHEVASFLKK